MPEQKEVKSLEKDRSSQKPSILPDYTAHVMERTERMIDRMLDKAIEEARAEKLKHAK